MRSPIDDFPAPEQLTARVVEPSSRPRLHGFDVQDDLVRHYDFAEMCFIAVMGRAPAPHEGRGLNVVLGFVMPIGVDQAPCHAAVVARMCGADSQRVVGAAAVALSEQARFEVERHVDLWRWLQRGRRGPPPTASTCTDPSEREAVARLHQRLAAAGIEIAAADASLGLVAALLAGFHCCGLTEPWQLHTMWSWARLPVVAAEAMATPPGSFGDYPIRQPAFSYPTEDEGPR